jgi:hypothetical protein
MINPAITDREHIPSVYWLLIKKTRENPSLCPRFLVIAQRKFIKGETIGMYCGRIVIGLNSSDVSIYARKCNGIIIDPEIGFDEIYDRSIVNPMYGIGLHHILTTNQESESNAFLSDSFVVIATKTIDIDM